MLNWEKELIILKSKASVDTLDIVINEFIKEKFKEIFEKLGGCSLKNDESLVKLFSQNDYLCVLNQLKNEYLTE